MLIWFLSTVINKIQNRLAELASQISSNAILDSFIAHLNKLKIAQFEDHAVWNGIKAESAGCVTSSGFCAMTFELCYRRRV